MKTFENPFILNFRFFYFIFGEFFANKTQTKKKKKLIHPPFRSGRLLFFVYNRFFSIFQGTFVSHYLCWLSQWQTLRAEIMISVWGGNKNFQPRSLRKCPWMNEGIYMTWILAEALDEYCLEGIYWNGGSQLLLQAGPQASFSMMIFFFIVALPSFPCWVCAAFVLFVVHLTLVRVRNPTVTPPPSQKSASPCPCAYHGVFRATKNR